ncbi:sensor histidine kinase [Flavobacterium sp. U410]
MDYSSQVGSLIIIGTGLIVILVLILLFLAVFYQTNLLKIKRKEAELLLKASLESEKKERQRIAADIHDGVSGDLNAVRNFIAILLRSETDEGKKEMFTEIKSGVEAALENTRLVSYKLMPPLLEKAGFLPAFKDYLDRINNETQVFTLNYQGSDHQIPSEQAYELFRILQEFTSNMMKYGNITSCNFVYTDFPESYQIEIQDDGIPFNFKEQYAVSKGAGLKNISSRIKAIEANFEQIPVERGNKFVILVKK